MTPHWLNVGVHVPLWHVIAIYVIAIIAWGAMEIYFKSKD